jgi:hypothetical protein
MNRQHKTPDLIADGAYCKSFIATFLSNRGARLHYPKTVS